MKVVIIGAAGGIGQALSLLLKIYLPDYSKLYLYDTSPNILGIALELNHIPTSINVKGFSGNYPNSSFKDADIILISAGLARKPGMQRSDLFNTNANIICNIIEKIAITAPKALIGIITNPVNTTVVIASEILKKYHVYDKNRLFGITTLDIIRANTLVATLKDQNPQDINVPVIGGHSSTTIVPLLSKIKGINLKKQEIISLTESIQNSGTKIVEAKVGSGSATLSMGYAATKFCMSLVNALQGKENILEYAYIEGDGKYAKFFSQAFILGKHGIKEYKSFDNLSDFENSLLMNMLNDLNKDIIKGEHFCKC
ncbi:MAG: malate dehydrogenase [Pantoea sp. Brub]|nr:malate dehydrogenase [Pantoea sp. Brub]